MKLARNLSVLGLVGAALLVGAGCSSSGADADEAGIATGAATPAQNSLVFEQVKTCDNLFKDRAAFRDVDLQEGVLRWKCGDVDGVTIFQCEDNLALLAEEEAKGTVTDARRTELSKCGNGYGQEYCEYNAVADGNIVNSVKTAVSLKDADVVQCVFTSVQSDFKGTDASPEALANDLALKIKPQIIAAARTPEGRVAAMKQSVNSRGAADTLIADCSALAKGGSTSTVAKDADRQVLCYNAWSAAATDDARAKLQDTCKGTDLSDDAAWAKTGLKDVELTDADHDLAACTMVHAAHGGVSWRNSDPTICARSYRAARECNVSFQRIGSVAPTFPGFSMQGWTNRTALPPGCKYASLDNAPAQVVICTAGAQDVKNYRTQKKPLQTLCRDKFGVNVAMQAPIGALANLSAAKEETSFCKAFVAGARQAQAPAPVAKQ